ncbi:hypothetical protein IT157_07835 [bacterium]|nr:hypothetical protein [bacterium]
MLYSDLVNKTRQLAQGAHVIYNLESGKVIIQQVGVRHHYLTQNPEYRLAIEVGGKRFTPRHTDFLSDYLLKVEARPELRLALSDACDALCNGAKPSELIEQKKLPANFADEGLATWTFQTSSYQTGGLPTALLLCGLQCLIRVYELNDPNFNAREEFRKAFLEIQGGAKIEQIGKKLMPHVRPGKRYFDKLERA